MAGELILVVDDGNDMREFVVQYVLEPEGYRTLVAEDGKQGLDLAVAESPDLILLDLQMPRMDGVSMLRMMKQHQLNIPVVLMTFHGSEEIAIEVFRMGAIDYVIKPFNVDELLDAIENGLAETRLRKERDDLTERLLNSNLDLIQRVEELEALSDVGRAAAALVDLDSLLKQVVNAAMGVTKAASADVYVLDGSRQLIKRATRTAEGQAAAVNAPTTDQNTYTALQSSAPVTLAGGTAEQAFSFVYVPVMLGSAAVGVIRVATAIEVTEHHTRSLAALADYVALSVERDRQTAG